MVDGGITVKEYADKWLLVLLLVGIIVVAMGFLTCGGGDDDDDSVIDDDQADDDTTEDDDVADDDVADDDTVDDDTVDDDTTGPAPFIGGVVIDTADGSPLGGGTVEALWGMTGEPFTPEVIGTANEDGEVYLELPLDYLGDVVAVRVRADDYFNTVQFGVPVNVDVLEFPAVSEATAEFFADTAGVILDDSKCHLSGFVHWDGPSGSEPVGCATVTLDPDSGELFYFEDNGLPSLTRTDTNPLDGLFVFFNVDPTVKDNIVSISADVDGNEASTFVPKLLPNEVVIVSIPYTEDFNPANPTPPGCE